MSESAYPSQFRYTREHEWVALEGQMATVGITDHAQQELGDVVFVKLPNKGDYAEAGKPFCTVESVKAVSDVFSPVSGQVAEVNASLADTPEWINEDPHGKAWLVKVQLSSSLPSDLMTAAQYEEYVGQETSGAS